MVLLTSMSTDLLGCGLVLVESSLLLVRITEVSRFLCNFLIRFSVVVLISTTAVVHDKILRSKCPHRPRYLDLKQISWLGSLIWLRG